MKPGLSTEEITAIVAALAGFDCAAIYLFGSRASSRHRPESDIDIAFLPTRAILPLDCFDLANRLSDQLGKQVDLVNLSASSTVLAKEVVSKGTALSIRNQQAFQTFEMHTLSDYARLNEERKEIIAS